jgi:hypothetical protein
MLFPIIYNAFFTLIPASEVVELPMEVVHEVVLMGNGEFTGNMVVFLEKAHDL